MLHHKTHTDSIVSIKYIANGLHVDVNAKSLFEKQLQYSHGVSMTPIHTVKAFSTVNFTCAVK